jgi:hypothetical protein
MQKWGFALVIKKQQDRVGSLMKWRFRASAKEGAISALDGLTIDQHKSWKAAVDRIKKLLA